MDSNCTLPDNLEYDTNDKMHHGNFKREYLLKSAEGSSMEIEITLERPVTPMFRLHPVSNKNPCNERIFFKQPNNPADFNDTDYLNLKESIVFKTVAYGATDILIATLTPIRGIPDALILMLFFHDVETINCTDKWYLVSKWRIHVQRKASFKFTDNTGRTLEFTIAKRRLILEKPNNEFELADHYDWCGEPKSSKK